MWVLIIIVVVVGIIYFTYQNDKEKIVDTHLSNGGLRKSFPIFTSYLENNFEMTFFIDSGKYFTYSKTFNDNEGVLFIGIKLSLSHEPVIYSKFKSNDNREYDGGIISGVDFNNVKTVEKCINLSLEQLKKVMIENGNTNSHMLKAKHIHKDLSTITKDEFKSTIYALVAENELGRALLMIDMYLKCYPEEKNNINQLKTNTEQLYYASDDYLSGSPDLDF